MTIEHTVCFSSFELDVPNQRLWGREGAGEIAAELALHRDRGRDYQRAAHYRLRAAQNALQRSAHREAIDHLMEGLELLKHLPDT